jgi:hypothetical protein
MSPIAHRVHPATTCGADGRKGGLQQIRAAGDVKTFGAPGSFESTPDEQPIPVRAVLIEQQGVQTARMV